MLEVGQPGELPLMRELSTLQKSKGLRDPLTQTSARKSPVLEAVSATTTEFNLPFQEGYADGIMRNQHSLGGSGRRDGIRAATPSRRGGLLRSPQLGDANAKPSWDFPSEAFMDLDASQADFHKQREDLKNHLEKLGILGNKAESGKQMLGGKSLLHNWRPAGGGEDDDEDYDDEAEDREVDGPFAVERYEQEVSPDMRSWLDAARDEASTHRGSAFQDEGLARDGFRRSKASHKASRMSKPVNRTPRQNAQILSPLVLNSHEDLHKFSQSRSLFTLEEPYEVEEEYLEEETDESDLTSAHNPKDFQGGFRSHSPLGPAPQARRSTRKHASTGNYRHSHLPPDITSEAGRSSLRPGPWEAEFFEYDMDRMEVPRKESGKSSQHRSKNHKPPKYYSVAQESAMISDSRKLSRRKGGPTLERQAMMRQQFASAARVRSAEVEPLPLLTELEDYNESEDFSASSVDGDGGHRNEGHYGQSLVRLEDTENLQLAFPECKELALCDYKPRNLSQKYRPRVFEEVVGQNIVTQALSNAILRGKIAPVYLFQGSRGTGKTSAARIFAAALICTSPEERRPCGVCRECISVATAKCSEVKEVDAASNNGIERVKALLEETISAPPLSRYKVFIIDECHVLTTETWNALLKILEEPPMNVVFILITTDPDRLPRTAVSRCQKFPFPKIKECEIVKRLQQLAGLENFEIDLDTLQLIASRSDGSLRDAETTLDQLSLLGQDINSSTVYELVGSASDERMLSLLDSALLADTVGTVRRARELVDSGVEPLSLMSRLATLITDILAGSFKFSEGQRKGFFRKQTLSEEKLEWLRMAMKTLSEAEKQLRVSNDRTTWLTAALLQLGPDRSCMFPTSCAGTSVSQSPVALDDMGENEACDFEHTSSGRQTWDDDVNRGQTLSSEMVSLKSEMNGETRRHVNHDISWSMKRSSDMPSMKFQRKLPRERSTHSRASPRPPQPQEKQPYDEDLSDDFVEDTNSGQMLSSSKLDEIWCRVVEKCQPLPLRQLLHAHVKLISISMSEVDAVAHLEVSHPEHKARCERSQKSIANVFKSVLGFPVDVKISLASLPAENEPATRNWTPVGNFSAEQDPGRCTSKRGIPSERLPTKGYSLSHWKHSGSGVSSMEAHQSNPLECFPAIPQASFGSPVKDIQYLDQAGPSWNSKNMRSMHGGVRPAHPNSTMEIDSQQAMTHESRRVSPLMVSLPGNMSLEDVRRRAFQEGGDGYRRGLDFDDIESTYSDGGRNIGEDELQSPEPHEAAALGNMNRPRHGSMEGPLGGEPYCVDGRRSCDADPQKRKGSSLKMVRRLTMRSRTKSLPSSNPNSPDDRGSSRFAVKAHTNSQKNRDAHHSGEEEAGDFVDASSMVAAQKKSKLKGAAGSFARFFKGSK